MVKVNYFKEKMVVMAMMVPAVAEVLEQLVRMQQVMLVLEVQELLIL